MSGNRLATGSVDRLTLRHAMTRTPLRPLRIRYRDAAYVLRLKVEHHNPTGSIKYRTAIGLLDALHREAPLRPGTSVVESTSGNLGLAMAKLLDDLGCRLVAVVDPKVPEAVRRELAAAGAERVPVDEPDPPGGYLLTRLARLTQLRALRPGLRWTDQYGNPANPGIHREVTAPELVEQTGGRLDALLVAVSTGGTLAGLSDGVRARLSDVDMYAVDVEGSIVTTDAGHRHLLSGIGASRKSSFLRPEHYTRALRVADASAVAVCRMLAQDTGLALGGSSGAVIAAFIANLHSGPGAARWPVAVVADSARNYLTTCYDDDWLASHDALGRVEAATAEARAAGLSFDLPGGGDG